MSEPKRVPLQTLEFPDSLGHAAKKDKDKKLLPSHRFTLTLPESNEKTCPEFNYAQLIKAAEKKKIKELKRKDDHTANGLDPFDDDDDDKLKEMAKKFEAKYGNATSGKKNHKFDGYTDLGAGYDENDSFIDNTDAYDEIVPDEMTTAHGGFYINCGALEFKSANNNSINNINNDNDNEEESSEEDEDEEETPKRVDKRINSISDDEDGEEITGDHPAKKQKMEEFAEKKPNNDSVIRKKKKSNHQSEETQNDSSQNTRESELLKKNSEYKVDNLEKETNGEPEEKKKLSKSNDVQRSKPTGEKKFDIKKFEKKVTSNGFDSKRMDVKNDVDIEKDSKIDDAIESVVNASRVDVDESSRETSDSGKSRGAPGTESDCEELDKQECPLPDCLPEDIKELCSYLKTQARKATAPGKTKFFNQDVNTSLFSLESKLRMVGVNNTRLQTYRHLAHYLPCTKTTLINRAKKLHMQYQEGRVKSQLEKLKTIIDRVMPAAEEKYKKECQRIVEDKSQQSPATDPLADNNEADESVNKNMDKMPQKKFPWNEESINIVREMASCRKNYFKISRPRKESLENFVSSFFESEVLPLWPTGWMKLQTLLNCATSSVPPKKKQKKSKDSGLSSNAIVIASGSVNNTPKSESVTNNTSLVGSEKGKTFSNSYKVNSTENSLNLTITKAGDSCNEKKQSNSKHKEKSNNNIFASQQPENATPNVPIGKITVVPTAQLLAKPSTINHVEKFNPMDLTSNSSLSITPVDYQKSSVTKSTEVKKDTVSIIPFTDSTHNESNISQSVYLPRQEIINQNSVMVSMPIRVLQEAAIDTNVNRKVDDQGMDYFKGEKKRDRYYDGKHKFHESKKRKRENRGDLEKIDGISGISFSKEDQDQKQIDETVAATNYLSQIINDDSPEKQKDPISIDDLLGSTPASDQEKDVQMVMRSIQQLQEVLNNSPTNPSVGSSASKSIKNDIQYTSLGGLYSKNDNNYRISKEDSQW